MVFFTCNACGSSLKKNLVEKHYQNECRDCSVLSCMDCGQDFYGDEYANHTKCISEAEKYQGAMFKGTGNKGDRKQQEWLERARSAIKGAKVNPRISSILEKMSDYPNIPRKKPKFQNFIRNSLNIRDQSTLDKVWAIFNQASQSPTTESHVGENDGVKTANAGRKHADSAKAEDGASAMDEDNKTDLQDTEVKEEVVLGSLKRRKRTMQCVSDEEDGDQVVPMDLKVSLKKKKKRKKQEPATEDQNNELVGGMVSEDHSFEDLKKVKKRKKRETLEKECKESLLDVEREIEESLETKRKRKVTELTELNKENDTIPGQETVSNGCPTLVQNLKVKKKKKDRSDETISVECEVKSGNTLKKKKKKDRSDKNVSEECVVKSEATPKKKKKKDRIDEKVSEECELKSVGTLSQDKHLNHELPKENITANNGNMECSDDRESSKKKRKRKLHLEVEDVGSVSLCNGSESPMKKKSRLEPELVFKKDIDGRKGSKDIKKKKKNKHKLKGIVEM